MTRGKHRKEAGAVRRVTLRHIAAQAGCCVNTASLALRGSTRISAPLRKRILGIARELGYVPSLTARKLRSRRSGLIGVFALGLYDDERTAMVNQAYSSWMQPIAPILSRTCTILRQQIPAESSGLARTKTAVLVPLIWRGTSMTKD